MKFLTGDDVGILKWVRVEAQKVERFGPQRRGDAVCRLAFAGPAASVEDRVAVAYASGALELRHGTTGEVLASAALPTPGVKCLERLGTSDFLAVSATGAAGVVAGWRGGEAWATAEGEELARTFELPGPVADAKVDPCGSEQLAFGGGDNDVKLWDLTKGVVSWRAKNVRESSLYLKVPVRVNVLQWATPLATSRSLVVCGSVDGKVRLYDTRTQRKPLFELVVGHGVGAGTGGYTGTVDEQARPLNCSAIASVRGDGWGFFVGNTMGVLREYDLRNLHSVQSSPYPPGRKAHLNWAARQMPFRRGYKGIMGAIRDVDVHKSGDAIVAVGIGRFAYVFETRKKRMHSKVYLKQKLCSVLVSAEEHKTKQDASEEEACEDEEAAATGDGPEGPDDELAEGFSSDEEADKGAAGLGGGDEDDKDEEEVEDDDEDDSEEEVAEAPEKGRRKAAAPVEVERQQTTVIRPSGEKAAAEAAAAQGKKRPKRGQSSEEVCTKQAGAFAGTAVPIKPRPAPRANAGQVMPKAEKPKKNRKRGTPATRN